MIYLGIEEEKLVIELPDCVDPLSVLLGQVDENMEHQEKIRIKNKELLKTYQQNAKDRHAEIEREAYDRGKIQGFMEAKIPDETIISTASSATKEKE